MADKTPRRASAEIERKTLKRLRGCWFATGAGDKRFVQEMNARLDKEGDGLLVTARQSEFLKKLVWKYRRQLGLDDANAKGLQGKLATATDALNAELLVQEEATCAKTWACGGEHVWEPTGAVRAGLVRTVEWKCKGCRKRKWEFEKVMA